MVKKKSCRKAQSFNEIVSIELYRTLNHHYSLARADPKFLNSKTHIRYSVKNSIFSVHFEQLSQINLELRQFIFRTTLSSSDKKKSNWVITIIGQLMSRR